jgi:hypothetical protein
MTSRVLGAVVTIAIGLAAAGPAAMAAGAQPVARPVFGAPSADPVAHDPTLIRQGRYWYSIITGDAGAPGHYLPIKRSLDLVHWTPVGSVFSTPPAWLVAELGRTPADLWAPDVEQAGGGYRLYYAGSTFGTNHSVIGLATSPTLDPDSPSYGWTDQGMVIRSTSADNFNAIDPDVVLDAAGVPWLSFGSFWDGVKMRRLDAATGLPSAVDTTIHSLASRGGASIEGPSIVRHDGYYYLFVSFDFCCRGVNSDYRVVVGRSAEVTGPYRDAAGVDMLAGGGTEVLRGYDEFRGTGGGDVVQAGPVDLYAHHYYDRYDNGTPKLSVRPISWRGGWPRLGDPISGSQQVGRGSAWFRLVDRASGAVVENIGCGYEGADISLAVRRDSTCQQWRPEERDGGYSSLSNRFSNKVAEVTACVNAEGARVAQWGWLNNVCQEFRFVAAGDGWLQVENRIAGRALAPAACGGVGAPIQTFTPTADTCQQFRLDPVGDVLIAGATGQRVLATVRFEPTTGAWYRIVTLAGGRRIGGEWRIEPLNDGTYNLVGRASGRMLQVDGSPVVRLLTPS